MREAEGKSLTLQHLLTMIDAALLRQHRAPLDFLLEVERKGFWGVIWPARLLAMLVVPLLMGGIALFYNHLWEEWEFLTSVVSFYLCVSFLLVTLFTFTVTWRFWFLYLFSPPLLALSFLAGFAGESSVVFVLAWIIGFPFATGVLLADAVALGLYKLARNASEERAHQRQRNRIEAIQLRPHPKHSHWARLIRLALAGLLIVVAIMSFVQQENNLSAFGWSAVWLFGALGSLHLEATLGAVLGISPLVSYNAQRKRWQATYIGRHALIVPSKLMRQTIAPEPDPIHASAAVIALLSEGCLGALIRSAVARLSEEDLMTLLLHLSLHQGGAEAIRFIAPPLEARGRGGEGARGRQSLRPIAEYYASLASEAAKPLDLQRWLDLLVRSNESFPHASQSNINQTLSHAYEALLEYDDPAKVEQAYQQMQQLVARLYHSAGTDLPHRWPVALLKQLEVHKRLLQGGSS